MSHEEQQQQQLTGPSLILETHGRIKQTITVTTSSSSSSSSSSEAHKYFLSLHRVKTPDIRLHIGQGENGPLAAVAYIRSWSRIYHIGVGTHDDDASMQWVDYKSKFSSKEPTFEWKGTTYILRRKLKRYFEVQDGGTGKRVAWYSPVGKESVSGKGTAVLDLAEGISEDLEKVILLGICSWREEMRRAG